MMGVAYVNVHVSRYLKEELAWALDSKTLFKTVMALRN